MDVALTARGGVLICVVLMLCVGSEEAVPALPGSHDVHWRWSQNRHQGVPVPVQTEEVELQHSGQHLSVRTRDADW